jgi:hypothetical protein
MDASVWEYTIVAVIGGLLGLCELISRYRDEPALVIRSGAAIGYIFINVAAALIALLLLVIFRVTFNVDPAQASNKLIVLRLLAAGLGAMAFFRSSLFTLKLGDKDVPLGPGLVLQILLDVTDRATDRNRAGPRAVVITDIMADIDFEKARLALPAYCFGLMQNVSGAEQTAIRQQVDGLRQPEISPPIRSYLLGLLLMNVVGEKVLRAAKKSLGTEILRTPPAQASELPPPRSEGS